MTPTGKSIDVSDAQAKNAELWILVRNVPANVTAASFVQLPNADGQMVVTLPGIVMDVKDMQLLNTPVLISVTLSGSVTAFSFAHDKNAYWSMPVTL